MKEAPPKTPQEAPADTAPVLFPPVDVVVRFWPDSEVEVLSPLADWLTCAVLNRALENYVEYVVTPAEEEDE
jgi:hypothetical protein